MPPINPTTAPRGVFLAMAFVAGGVVTNIYFNQPMLPLIARDLGAPEGAIGLIPGFTVGGFALGLATLVPLGDRHNRKTIVLAQIALAAVFAVLCAVAPNFPVLLAASLGLGVCSCVPQQMTPFAAAMAAPGERGRSVGIVVSGIMVGLLAGRAVGGALSALVGWRPVFGVAAAFMVAVWFITWKVLPDGVPTTTLSYTRLIASMGPLAREHRALRLAMATQALMFVAFTGFWASLASLLAQPQYNLGPFWAGAFGIVGLAGALAANFGGRAADRVGPMRVLAFSFTIVTLAYVVLLFATTSMTALIVGVIVLDLGCQSALIANQTRVFGLDPKAQGRVNTLFMVATFLGGSVGAALSGWLMARYGWTGVACMGCAAGLAAGAIHANSFSRELAPL
jgi:predicted MFS family arabinose efflux permease